MRLETFSVREQKRMRKQIWESMNGCDCPVDAATDDRCTRNAVRCKGRYGTILARMKEKGLKIP